MPAQQAQLGDWVYTNPRTIRMRVSPQPTAHGVQAAPGAAGNGHVQNGVHPGRVDGAGSGGENSLGRHQ